MNLFTSDIYGGQSLPSHHHDPATSKLAAKSHSRQAQGNAAIVLELVRRFPGKTAAELFAVAGDADRATLRELHEVRHRLSDLRRKGLVVAAGARACEVRGNASVTWRVA